MALMHDQIDDFVEATLKRFKKRSWVDLSLELQHYEFAGRLATMKKLPLASSYKLNWKLQVTNTGTARFSGMYDTDVTNVKNLIVGAEIPYCKSTVNMSYDIDEPEFQEGPEEIIDFIRVREHSMYNDYFELMEQAMWSLPSGPVTSASETRESFGIPYWIVKNATQGFNGGNPAGFSAGAAGVSSTTYPTWSNWTDTYAAMSRGDGIDAILTAMDKTKFNAPHAYNELGGGTPDLMLYTTYPVLQEVRRELQASNDNLGNDIGRYSGDALVRSTPLRWVPALTESSSDAYDSTNPVYGINWKTLRWVFKRGRDMVRTAPQVSPTSHTVRTVHMDSWGNFQCDNRRSNFVIYQA